MTTACVIEVALAAPRGAPRGPVLDGEERFGDAAAFPSTGVTTDHQHAALDGDGRVTLSSREQRRRIDPAQRCLLFGIVRRIAATDQCEHREHGGTSCDVTHGGSSSNHHAHARARRDALETAGERLEAARVRGPEKRSGGPRQDSVFPIQFRYGATSTVVMSQPH